MSPEAEVSRLVAMYAFALDDRDYTSLGAMLAEDCLMAVGEARLEGREAIVAAVASMQTDSPGRHLLGPSVVEMSGPERASAWTDMLGVVPGPGGAQMIAGSWRYHDRLVNDGGRWVFTHRYLHAPAEPLIPGAPRLPHATPHAGPPEEIQ